MTDEIADFSRCLAMGAGALAYQTHPEARRLGEFDGEPNSNRANAIAPAAEAASSRGAEDMPSKTLCGAKSFIWYHSELPHPSAARYRQANSHPARGRPHDESACYAANVGTPRLHRRRSIQWRRGGRGAHPQSLRHCADGLPDAGARWLRSDPANTPQRRTLHEHPDHRGDGQRDGRRSRKMSRFGHERLHEQAGAGPDPRHDSGEMDSARFRGQDDGFRPGAARRIL